jgi:hypothetical protein
MDESQQQTSDAEQEDIMHNMQRRAIININKEQFNINAFNQKVKTNKGIIEIFIDPKCKKLLYNIDYLKFKQGTSEIDLPTQKEIEQDPDLKYLGHPFDAASYLVEYYWAIKNRKGK